MIRSLLIAVVSLILGVLGGLGYSHYVGDGKQLSDAQDALAKANANAAKAADDTQQAKKESTALSEQVQQLNASNDKLKQQVVAAAKPAEAPAPAASSNPFANMGGLMKTVLAGQHKSKLQALIARLHLTPEQQAKVESAMEEDDKRQEEAAKKMFSGEKVDYAAMKNDKAKTLDQTLDDILNPEQKTEYTKLKSDEKQSQAEMIASYQMNQMGGALQLSDPQKDQVYTTLTQVQMNATDPKWIAENLGSATGDPMATLDKLEKIKEDQLAKILSPAQMDAFRQQAQSQLEMQRTMIQKFMPGANKGGANSAPAGQ